jgi:hypothetical protein
MPAKIIEFNSSRKSYIDERIDQTVNAIMIQFEKDLRGLPVMKNGQKYIDFDHFGFFIKKCIEKGVEISDERNERVIGNLRKLAESQKEIDPEIQQIINDNFFEML